MSKPTVLVTRKWPSEVEEELKSKYDVTLNEKDVPMSIPELQAAFQNYDCVCPTVTDPINAEVLSVENTNKLLEECKEVSWLCLDLIQRCLKKH